MKFKKFQKQLIPLLLLLYFCSISSLKAIPESLSSPKNIVLVYSDYRQGFFMSKEELLPLVIYFNSTEKAQDSLFDGFLFLGKSGPSGGSYETGTANDKDWSWLLDRLLGSGNQVKNLQDAAEEASKLLGREVILKVIIVIPLADPNLNLSQRITKVKSYVDEVVAKFYSLNFKNLRLEGFYWMSESTYGRDSDLIRESCKYVHEKGFKMYWIPYFTAQG
ncbi:MAG: DUF4855 domain-containing protein, partial [Thermoproteota archaeon]